MALAAAAENASYRNSLCAFAAFPSPDGRHNAKRAPEGPASPRGALRPPLLRAACYGVGLAAVVAGVAGVVAAGAVDVPVTVFFCFDPIV